jgi:hypothetical protein
VTKVLIQSTRGIGATHHSGVNHRIIIGIRSDDRFLHNHFDHFGDSLNEFQMLAYLVLSEPQ